MINNTLKSYSLGLIHTVVTIVLSGLVLVASAFTGLSFMAFWSGSLDLLIVFIIAASTLASLLIFKSRISKCDGISRILFGALIIPFFAVILELYILYSVPTLTDTFSLLGPLSAYALVTVVFLIYLSKTKSN